MKYLLFAILLLIGFNSHSQKIISKWDKSQSESTLEEYIKNEVYTYLGFNKSQKDSLDFEVIKLLKKNSSDSTTIKNIRFSNNLNKHPITIINLNPIVNEEILHNIKLKMIDRIIIHKPSEVTLAVYGIRGRYGVIVIEMNEKKWRKIKRKTGN